MDFNTLPPRISDKLTLVLGHAGVAHFAENMSTEQRDNFNAVNSTWHTFSRAHTSNSLHDRIWRLKMIYALRVLLDTYVEIHITQDDTPGTR